MAEFKATERVLADQVAPIERPMQLPLLPSEALDDLPEEPGLRQAALRQRGPGRPKGSVNRSTTDWAAYLARRHTDPLVFLAETISRTPHDLAAELGCKPYEAFQLQRLCAADLAPYLHGKRPVDINVNGTGLIGLTIVTGGAAVAGELLIDGELLENQGDGS